MVDRSNNDPSKSIFSFELFLVVLTVPSKRPFLELLLFLQKYPYSTLIYPKFPTIISSAITSGPVGLTHFGKNGFWRKGQKKIIFKRPLSSDLMGSVIRLTYPTFCAIDMIHNKLKIINYIFLGRSPAEACAWSVQHCPSDFQTACKVQGSETASK